MKFSPVVEVVEAYGVLEEALVLNTGGGEDALARLVGVDVTANGHVEFFNSPRVEFAALLAENPFLEGEIGGNGLEEGERFGAVET